MFLLRRDFDEVPRRAETPARFRATLEIKPTAIFAIEFVNHVEGTVNVPQSVLSELWTTAIPQRRKYGDGAGHRSWSKTKT